MPRSCSPAVSEPRHRGRGAPRRGFRAAAPALLGALLAACAPKGVPAPAHAASPEVEWWPLDPPRDSWRPEALLTLPTGELIVADRSQNRLFRLVDGAVAERLPSPDRAPVEWTALSAAPGLSFYVLDGPGRRIHQYDLRGNYLGLALDLEALARREGIEDLEPAGLAVDRSGQAVVTDRLGDRLLVFAPGWLYTGTWGETGSAPGAWRRPGAVAVGDRAPFLVADAGNRRVVLLDEVGGVVAVREFEERVEGVAVLGPGRYAVSHGATVELLDEDLDPVERVLLPRAGACRERPYATAGLAGGAGVVLAGEGCGGRIARIRLGED